VLVSVSSSKAPQLVNVQPLGDGVGQDALALADLAHVIAELAQLVG
jgi:hypothetical protein